jgi:chorismate mutase
VKLRALRGAITCDEDTKSEIEAKTARMVKELFARNGLTADDVVSMVFTSTPDLHAEFPATAARGALGLDGVALIGAQEQDVPHGLARCIRVLVHCYSDRPRDELRHVFLEGAAELRPDLPE